MKDSKKYSKKIRGLYRSLKREYKKPEKAVYDEPVDAVVYAIVSENISEAKMRSVMRRFSDNFVDFNELRVSRPEEIIEVFGEDTAVARGIASELIRFLTGVFAKYNMVSLEALKKIGKRPARQALEKMEGMSHFAVDYCMLTSLQGHATPLTTRMIEYLRSNEMVHPEADEQQTRGFLARQISAEDAYEFYALLRRKSEVRKVGWRKKAARKTKATRTKKRTKKAKDKGKG